MSVYQEIPYQIDAIAWYSCRNILDAYLIVEQIVTLALERCDRAYVFETGQIRMEGGWSDLLHDERVMETYQGIAK